MIIMIIFLVLSVLFVIGTVIYVKNKDKRITTVQFNNDKTKDKKKKRKKDKKKLSNILQIKIKDNIICLGNRYSIVASLGSIDYNMLSFNEQESVEDVLIQTALSIDSAIQFFSTTEYIDTSNVIKKIKSNRFNNFLIKEYQKNLIIYLNTLMESNKVSIIKNYVVISYDGLYKNAINELDRKYLLLKNNLLRAKITCNLLSQSELYNLIYRELNKNSTLKIDNFLQGGENLYVGKKEKKTRKERRKKHIQKHS